MGWRRFIIQWPPALADPLHKLVLFDLIVAPLLKNPPRNEARNRVRGLARPPVNLGSRYVPPDHPLDDAVYVEIIPLSFSG